jgi:hypothetical protein
LPIVLERHEAVLRDLRICRVEIDDVDIAALDRAIGEFVLQTA